MYIIYNIHPYIQSPIHYIYTFIYTHTPNMHTHTTRELEFGELINARECILKIPSQRSLVTESDCVVWQVCVCGGLWGVCADALCGRYVCGEVCVDEYSLFSYKMQSHPLHTKHTPFSHKTHTLFRHNTPTHPPPATPMHPNTHTHR